ncbi:uncharacterized protein ACA1_142550 [Acanthamoeba castellanii str. Neff]|uniref:Uncharacterized protein n=1 Tax=Acanthamoeba castellanii (strain ATCC 30010 / Neff) TaxID=1257118 RepID=L8HBE0_ACACF|nr:uncharacterized protein ACA1_142550 [Acanthamoeba castellanii str. Neff]ELR22552.1 hypothetical protein ACA1_142550 [Acanthamoeba castellanii str. Neff]
MVLVSPRGRATEGCDPDPKWSELDRKNASRYAKELAHLKGKFEKEERLRKNAIKNLNRAHNALAAAMKEFEVAREALLGLEEQLSEKRAEQTQQRIIALEHYLSVEAAGLQEADGEERRSARPRSGSRERKDEEVKKERRDKEERDDRKPRGPSSGKQQQQQQQEKNKDKPLGGGGGGKSSREKAATLRSPRSKAAEKKP